MATGAAIASGVAGIAGSVSSGRKSDNLMDDAQSSIQRGVSSIEQYAEQAMGFGEDSLAFSQNMLADWESTFGGIEDNLSDYYANLDPAKYAANYKSDLNTNIDKQLGQMNDTMAASGLQTAGMQQQVAKEAAFAKATGGAQADLMAEDKVRSMQQGFVGTGANRQATAQAGVTNANNMLSSMATNTGNSIGSLYGNQANLQQRQAEQRSADSAGFMQGGLRDLTGGVGSMFGSGEKDPLKNIFASKD